MFRKTANKMKNIAFLVLLTIASCSKPAKSNTQPKFLPTEDIKKLRVSAVELLNEFEKNEVKADRDLKGYYLYVNGEVTDIKIDILKQPYVIFDAGHPLRRIQCFFRNADDAAPLNKGDSITVFGRCEGLMMNVIIKDCLIALKE